MLSLPLYTDIVQNALGDANMFLQTPKIISMAKKLKLIHILFSPPPLSFSKTGFNVLILIKNVCVCKWICNWCKKLVYDKTRKIDNNSLQKLSTVEIKSNGNEFCTLEKTEGALDRPGLDDLSFCIMSKVHAFSR